MENKYYYNNDEIKRLDIDDLESVSGGYPDSVNENLSADVIKYIENSVKSLRKKGGDRIDCGNALYKEKEKLYLMNEAAGKDYFIDWGYVNIMLDEIFGI